MDESEARWLRWERGEYAADPETKLLVLHERWESAGDDFARRDSVVRRAVIWVVEELRECVRLGRSFLNALPAHYRESPDTSSALIEPYRAFFELYVWRVEECLKRALVMAYRCQEAEAMGWELSAAVSIAEAHFRSASLVLTVLSAGAVETSIGYLEAAESAMVGAVHSEHGAFGEAESFSGVASPLPQPGKASEPSRPDDGPKPPGTEPPSDPNLSPEPSAPSCPVVLRGLSKRPLVRGMEVGELSKSRYEVIQALVRAWPDGLSKDEFPRRSGYPDAVRMLKKQAKKDEVWASVIELPGQDGRGLGYRIASE